MLKIEHFIDSIINIIFPNVCGICGHISNYDICPKCMLKLNEYKECKKHIYLDKNFTTYMYIFRYEGLIRDTIIKYKFMDQSYIYKSFVNFMIKNKKICRFLKSYDIIIPVPISKQRTLKRGYNQCELLLKELKKNSDLNINCKILYKVKNIVPQSSLSKENRINNVKNAYIVKNSEIIKDKKVLLVDDIYTTGNTLNECSRMLKLAGAYDVGALTLAKD